MTDTDAADGALVYLGLGTNLGDRVANLGAALTGLATRVTIDACSDVYETEPIGIREQPRFLNMAVRARALLAPVDLLHAVKQLERDMGRVTTVRMGPRIIDIDVLLYGGVVLEDAELSLPHPGLLHRPFVLRPLLDLDPELRHPVSGERLAQRLEQLNPGAGALLRLGSAADIIGVPDATGGPP
jgi:2-amino-4-hydroxy-6-hydroxymethyldihydropteridine diphosphokinase